MGWAVNDTLRPSYPGKSGCEPNNNNNNNNNNLRQNVLDPVPNE